MVNSPEAEVVVSQFTFLSTVTLTLTTGPLELETLPEIEYKPSFGSVASLLHPRIIILSTIIVTKYFIILPLNYC